MVRVAVAALALAAGGACKVDVGVGVEAGADGHGEVRATAVFDREAVETIGDLKAQLKVDDLRSAGWEIDGPRPAGGGGAEVVARHRFASPEEAGRLLHDLGGPTGPFQGFTLDQRRSFFRTETALRGTLDLGGGLGGFSDPRLQEALGGGLGMTEEQLVQVLGGSVDRAFALRLAADLPGKVTSNARGEPGGGLEWNPKFGQRVTVEAEGGQWNWANLALVAVAVLAALALAGVAARRLRPRPNVSPPP